MADIAVAYAAKDYLAVSRSAAALVKLEKSLEVDKAKVRDAALIVLGGALTAEIRQAIQPFLDRDELPLAEGVWFSWDFGELPLPTTRIRFLKATIKTPSTPSTPSTRTGGGGKGKLFNIGWKDLLAKHGATQYTIYGNITPTGMTCQQAWDANAERNSRFAVRKAMLLLEGLIE